MQFNSVSVLLLFLITFVHPLHGQTCNCIACLSRVTLNANSNYQVYNSAPCPAGEAAAVSELNVESTDGSGFEIRTTNDPSETTFYTAGSTTSSVTCFDMGNGRFVGGQKSRIYVVLSCKNWIQPCPLSYSIRLVCIPTGTVSTPNPTSASTVNTVNSSTSDSDTCVCRCCSNGYNSVTAGGSSIVNIQRCSPSRSDGTIIKMSNTCTIASCRQLCIDRVSTCADAVTLIPGSESAYKVELEATCRGHTVMVGRVIFVLLNVFVSSVVLIKN